MAKCQSEIYTMNDCLGGKQKCPPPQKIPANNNDGLAPENTRQKAAPAENGTNRWRLFSQLWRMLETCPAAT